MPNMIPRFVDYCNAPFHESLIAQFHSPYYPRQMDTKTESGKRIKAARKRLELTLADVCAQVDGLTVTRLSNWETGTRMISVDEAKRLAPALQTTAGYLLTVDDEPGDQRLQTLVATYKLLNDAGRQTVQRVAETLGEYKISSDDSQHDAA